MDTGTGVLTPVSDKLSDLIEGQVGAESESLKKRLFREGEIVKVKDSVFIIKRLSRHTLTLRLLADNTPIPDSS